MCKIVLKSCGLFLVMKTIDNVDIIYNEDVISGRNDSTLSFSLLPKIC